MIKLFKFFGFGSSSGKEELADQVYEAQRHRLSHTAASERSKALAAMCVGRKARLEIDLADVLENEQEGKSRFGRVKLRNLIKEQMADAQHEFLSHTADGEHHQALAVMYQGRITRLRIEISGLVEKEADLKKTPLMAAAITRHTSLVGLAKPKRFVNGEMCTE